ncbi:unnamed protein product [Moneuplotes crassus]|uniref:Protein lifeguard 4 n=1 Tax=Euplotes crassus TaxID=5936 RepID=A0AAD2D2B2_EUPCR|nr:unnamed protein product [Moneuplotes crassus]
MEQRSFQDDQKEVAEPVLGAGAKRSDDPQERKEDERHSINLQDHRENSERPLTSKKHEGGFNPVRQDSQRISDIKYSEEKEIQNQIISLKSRFVRYVYLIVLFQVSVTFFLSYICSDNYDLYKVVNNILVIILSYVALLACLLVFFMTNISQVFPYNYILLLLFTLCESFVIAGWTSDMKTDTVILCCGMCFSTTLILTFQIFTMKETSKSKGLFLTLVIGIVVQIIIAFFLISNTFLKLLTVGLGVLGYGCFLILNTNKISNELPLDEYILGSLLLYIDILTLFVYLLKQFGKKKR